MNFVQSRSLLSELTDVFIKCSYILYVLLSPTPVALLKAWDKSNPVTGSSLVSESLNEARKSPFIRFNFYNKLTVN